MVLGTGGGKMMEMFSMLILALLFKTHKTVLSKWVDFIVYKLYLNKAGNKAKQKIKI